jgi:hypothetical protein
MRAATTVTVELPSARSNGGSMAAPVAALALPPRAPPQHQNHSRRSRAVAGAEFENWRAQGPPDSSGRNRGNGADRGQVLCAQARLGTAGAYLLDADRSPGYRSEADSGPQDLPATLSEGAIDDEARAVIELICCRSQENEACPSPGYASSGHFIELRRPPGDFNCGFSVIRTSVVMSRPATAAAFCRAERMTLVGSMMPAFIISAYSPLCALKPKLVSSLSSSRPMMTALS